MRASKWIIPVAIGVLAGLAAMAIPHAIRLAGVELGDIGLPLAGLDRLAHGGSPYDVALRGTAPALYPFTTMMALWPLKSLPLRFVVPVFIGLSSFALALGIMRNGEPWQLLIFLSPAYWSAVQSVQWSPALTAALLLPSLLPLALVKPQLGVVLACSGRWSKRTIAAAAFFLLLSIAILPDWPIEWLRRGNLDTFNGRSPVMVIPGVLLLLAAFAWRKREGRLLLSMSVVPQRYLYDQLPLYLIPKTWRQMLFLLATSWAMVGTVLWLGILDTSRGMQRTDVWMALVVSVFLPALGILYYNNRRESSVSSGDA